MNAAGEDAAVEATIDEIFATPLVVEPDVPPEIIQDRARRVEAQLKIVMQHDNQFQQMKEGVSWMIPGARVDLSTMWTKIENAYDRVRWGEELTRYCMCRWRATSWERSTEIIVTDVTSEATIIMFSVQVV